MKKVQIENFSSIESQTTDKGIGNIYNVKPVCDANLLTKCAANFVEVEPGNTAYSYHYHESKEEIFYIISGSGILETIDGDVAIKAGDVLSFPTGKGGVHVVKNTSKEENLVYIDFGTKSEVEVVHLPKDNKIMVVSQNTFGIFEEPKEKL